MNPVEITATLFAALLLIKLIVVFVIGTEPWVKMSKKLLHSNMVVMFVYFILAGIVGYYLLQSGITIVQFAAIGLFMLLLIAAGFIPFADDALVFVKKMHLSRRDILKKDWLSIIIWAALAIWTLIAVF